MFGNNAPANLAFCHSAKHFDKLHHIVHDFENRVEANSSMAIVPSALCIIGISKTVQLILELFRHCAIAFVL